MKAYVEALETALAGHGVNIASVAACESCTGAVLQLEYGNEPAGPVRRQVQVHDLNPSVGSPAARRMADVILEDMRSCYQRELARWN